MPCFPVQLKPMKPPGWTCYPCWVRPLASRLLESVLISNMLKLQVIFFYHQLKPAAYVSRKCQQDLVATCYTCKKAESSEQQSAPPTTHTNGLCHNCVFFEDGTMASLPCRRHAAEAMQWQWLDAPTCNSCFLTAANNKSFKNFWALQDILITVQLVSTAAI